MGKKKDKKNTDPTGAQQPASDENPKGKDLYDNDMHNEGERRNRRSGAELRIKRL